MDLFSRLFLADGPGAERDSFLAARAGVAGRLARYLFIYLFIYIFIYLFIYLF